MSYQLKLDEMLDALCNSGHPNAAECVKEVEAIADKMAGYLCAAHGVMADAASFQGMAFAGTCVPFYPILKGQALPEALEGYDDPEEWGA